MACQVQASWLRSRSSIMENDDMDNRFHKRSHDRSGIASRIGIKSIPYHSRSFQTRRREWKISLALDPGAVSGDDSQEINSERTGLGSTRLGRIAIAGGKQLLEKFNAARKNFPMKIFLLLLGFYTANALATILGQTGDWDVLVAGVVVAAIEGIGMLMYKKPPSMSTGRFQSLVVMINFWKAGVCLGLFVDAFKLGS
ncbi:PREDICTED: ycf20-like protein [Tarenaya hassleriana]|uniref:ycf20-like protein n=1 Tax=Tarenaya hassleriana TaxID=28532 RepID=UPI00053C57AD|nr:PREDICTED: ycf20-like protein [Tarenaya hassleriana]